MLGAGRRQLREFFDRDGSAVAEEGLRGIAELYALEAELKGSPPETRRAVRQERARPLVEALGVWLAGCRAKLSAKSRAGEKSAYFANRWAGLCVYLEGGRVEIDSNAVENTIRPIALGRKNALFAAHDEGGRAWGRIASLIETAKMNAVEALAYLTATLEALAGGHPQSRLDELLPWAFRPRSS